jgi:hypothetical protein
MHTFDIRFDRAAGFAALLAEPANHFRWRGRGVLCVDPSGISVSAGRSLGSLLRRRARRIPAADIKEVYREGEALRLEFATPGSRRAVLPFWAKDHETATRIVSVLPTTRTIEVEGKTPPASRRRRRGPNIAVLFGLLGLAAGALLVIGLRRETAPVAADLSPSIPEIVVPPAQMSATPAAPPAEEDADWVTEVGELSAARIDPSIVALSVTVSPRYQDSIRPLTKGSPEHAFARQQLAMFMADTEAIAAAFLSDQRDWSRRLISREDFVARLEANEFAWWDVTFRILDDRQFQQHRGLAEFRRLLLTAARMSRLHLTLFAQGVRKRDPEQVALANQALERANEFRALLRRYVP